jgi:nitrate/nitrite transport system ATP-binding protein
MPYLELRNVSKSYGAGAQRVEVLKDINLKVEKGDFVAIVGYSGVGKSTLMNLIAGLDTPDAGEILVKGRDIDGPHPERGLVFQNYSLLPWLSVWGNVALAVDQVFRYEPRAKRRELVRRAIDMVKLTHAAHKRPSELSGGMRQRVSVARTLATQPKIMLLDEPLSALDALTRGVIQDQILEIWEREHQTILLITNDVDEGLYLANRIIPLSLGPGATFGPEVKVNLERPRQRAALNHCEEFKQLRKQVTDYLLDQKAAHAARQENTGSAIVPLPDLQPCYDHFTAAGSARRAHREKFGIRHAKTLTA